MRTAVWLTLLFPASAFAIDADADGFDSSVDCDDANPAVNPAAAEGGVADGIDQDCSGFSDDQTVCAGGDYLTIQDGIDSAPQDFTLRICAGVYPENLTIQNKRLTLLGDGFKRVGVNGGGTGRALTLRGGSMLTIQGITFFNGASNTNGGAMRCEDSGLSMTKARLMNSSATRGGGLSAEDCTLDLQRVLFTNNTATDKGGGLYIDEGSGTLTDLGLVDNEADQGGGLAIADGAFTLTGATVLRNHASSTQDYTGGGGAWIDGPTAVHDSTFADNTAALSGGGIYFHFGTGELTGNVFDSNHADDDGGGVFTEFGSMRIADNTITNNDADDDAGGLRIYRGDMVIEDNLIEGNSATDDGGGAKMSHSTNVFRNNTFLGNSTFDAGGGLELDNESSDVVGCHFEGNSAGRGGALHSWRNEETFSISECTFVSNAADECGGAMAFDNDPHLLTVHDVVVENNTAEKGGAVCMEYKEQDDGSSDDSLVKLRNALLLDNTAGAEGGDVWVEAGIVQIDNVTLVNGEAPAGAALFADEGDIYVRNTVIAGHTGGSVSQAEPGWSIQSTYTNYWGHTGGFVGTPNPMGSNGNLDLNPLLNASYGLGLGSPLIDAGDPNLLDSDGSVSDMGKDGGPGGS